MSVQPRSSLEDRTKLVGQREAGWRFVLYPGAAEGGGGFRSASADPLGASGLPPDADRNASDSARRARAKLRRYCAHNRLNRLGTLTYGEPYCTDPRQLRGHLATFIRRLRAEVGEAFPYVWVPELHSDHERFHAHFAIGRYVHYTAIRRSWSHGFIHITMLGDLPVGSGTLGEARKAAGYLAKYVGKDLGRTDGAGLHRYEVGQRFQPPSVVLTGRTAAEVIERAETYMGAEASYLWRSRDEEEWQGPPALFASWT